MKTPQQSINVSLLHRDSAQRAEAALNKIGGYLLVVVIALGTIVAAHTALGAVTGLDAVLEQAEQRKAM